MLESNVATKPQQQQTPINKGVFSYYKPPITNVLPNAKATLLQIHKLITGDKLKDISLSCESLYNQYYFNNLPKKEYDNVKRNLPYVTFSGVFEKRHDKGLLSHSGFICLDFDPIKNPYSDYPRWYTLENHLKQDTKLNPVFSFLSPSKNGLKIVVPIDTTQADHAIWFDGLSKHIQTKYGADLAASNITLDKSGRDVSRACFVCHDKSAWIHPDFKTNQK